MSAQAGRASVGIFKCCLRTSDPRVARIRRDNILPEVRQMLANARARPKLEDVLPDIRRAELAQAHGVWTELIADRGVANAHRALDALDEHDDHWWRRARQAILQHGLADLPSQSASSPWQAHSSVPLTLVRRSPVNRKCYCFPGNGLQLTGVLLAPNTTEAEMPRNPNPSKRRRVLRFPPSAASRR